MADAASASVGDDAATTTPSAPSSRDAPPLGEGAAGSAKRAEAHAVSPVTPKHKAKWDDPMACWREGPHHRDAGVTPDGVPHSPGSGRLHSASQHSLLESLVAMNLSVGHTAAGGDQLPQRVHSFTGVQTGTRTRGGHCLVHSLVLGDAAAPADASRGSSPTATPRSTAVRFSPRERRPSSSASMSQWPLRGHALACPRKGEFARCLLCTCCAGVDAQAESGISSSSPTHLGSSKSATHLGILPPGLQHPGKFSPHGMHAILSGSGDFSLGDSGGAGGLVAEGLVRRAASVHQSQHHQRAGSRSGVTSCGGAPGADALQHALLAEAGGAALGLTVSGRLQSQTHEALQLVLAGLHRPSGDGATTALPHAAHGHHASA